MEKLLILSILVLGLASCGEKKVDITPKEEKIKIVQGHLKRDYELRKKYYSIQEELQKMVDEGNESAEKELDKWKEILEEEQTKLMFEISEQTKKDVEKARKTGKLWN